MKKLLIALAFLPFAAGVACAAETLTDQQMDRVTAGTAIASADAFAFGPSWATVVTATDTTTKVAFWGTVSASSSFSGVFFFF
jgi:hypothetical protein